MVQQKFKKNDSKKYSNSFMSFHSIPFHSTPLRSIPFHSIPFVHSAIQRGHPGRPSRQAIQAGHPTVWPAGHPGRPSRQASWHPSQAATRSATRRLMLEPKILIFHWFFKQKWPKPQIAMGVKCSMGPLKKPLEPHSDKLFGEILIK